MTSQQIAIISDVHGNISAYRAVLDDIARQDIERVINLGDVVGKGPRGSEAVGLSQTHCEVTVRGNWDAHLSGPVEHLDPAGLHWRDELSDADRRWLAGLPNCHDLLVSGRRIRLFHASAQDEFTRVHFHHSTEDFEAMFANTPFTGPGAEPTMVGYGDVHDTFLEVSDGRSLFNVGSVGNPLDEPSAAYVVIDGVLDSPEPRPFGLRFVRVPYPVETEIAVARAADMPTADAYAIELRTAIYRGAHRNLGLVAY